MEGWVKVHRSFMEWEWYNKPEMVHLFLHLLISANHKKGYYQGIEIQRGQLVTGLKSLSLKTNLSIQTLRSCLKRLKKTGEINTESTSKSTLITICNYDSYQSSEIESNTQPNKQVTNDQQTINKQVTTNNNVKNKKNDNNDKNISLKEKNENIFSHFILLFNENSGKRIRTLDKKAKKQLLELLKQGYKSEDFVLAIQNCKNDPYHLAHPKYLTAEFITREDKFQMYLAANQVKAKNVDPKKMTTIQKVEEWNSRDIWAKGKHEALKALEQ